MSLALSAGGCGRGDPAGDNTGPLQGGTTDEPAAAGRGQPAALRWDLQPSGQGTALALLAGSGAPIVRLFCPSDGKRLLVNVPAFRAIGSEERLSFGGGGDAVALVADSSGDPVRGGVTGAGPVPPELERILAGPISASYGAQVSGPHPPAAPEDARAFAAACNEATPAAQPGPAEGPLADRAAAGACRMQDGKVLPPNLLKAVGTEPFWAARIEGRCVTYMTPDDQKGTRIWTQFIGSRERGVWIGSHANDRFVLRTRLEPGCSDGMSDKRYPLAVSLSVAGEQRTGCADLL